MSHAVAAKQFRFRTNRPTDATWWFWSMVCVLAGVFYSFIFPIVGIGLLLAAPCCFVWQFVSWYRDVVIRRQAEEWCWRNYPGSSDFRMFNFMVALAHEDSIELKQLDPATPLDQLHPIFLDDDEEEFLREFGSGDRPHEFWLGHLFDVARVKDRQPAAFVGTTLHVVVCFVSDST